MIRQQDKDLFEALVLAEPCMCAAHLGYSEPEQDGKTYRLGIAGLGLLCNSIYPLSTLTWNQITPVRRPFHTCLSIQLLQLVARYGI